MDTLKQVLDNSTLDYELYNTENDQNIFDLIDNPTFTEPDIIFFSLNSVEIENFKFLEERKMTNALKHIPVIVFTTGHDHDTIARAYELRANTVIKKSKLQNVEPETMETIINYWYSIAYLPKS